MTIFEADKPHASDLAKSLDLSAPTVSQALKNLIKKNWVTQNSDKSYVLTDQAQEIATQIITNKSLMMDFMVNFLKIDKAVADRDSCKIEHLLSPETSHALEAWLIAQRQGAVKSGGLPVVN